jgi:hypothetical protein
MDLREIKNEVKREIETELELYQEKVNSNTKELELLKQISTDNLMASHELRKSVESLAQNDLKLEKRLESLARNDLKLEKRLEALTQNVQRLQESQEALTQSVQKLEKSQESLTRNDLKLEKRLESLTRNVQRFQDEMKEFKDEMKEFKIEINKKWGELANRLGTLAEDIFGPGIPYLLKSLGYETELYFFDLGVGPKGRKRQYDVLIFARSEQGKKKVFVAEVKNQARTEDFNQMQKSLEALPELFEPVRGKTIVPILAAFRFPENIEIYASKRGVLLVRMGGEYLEPLNREVLRRYE